MSKSTISIYAEDFTARHVFIFDLIFSELLGLKWKKVDHIDHAIINYSKEKGGGVWFNPNGILSDNSIIHQDINFVHDRELSYFFENKSNSHLPFDLFGASFYLVTRYEEYLPFKADDHNRFPATASILTQNNVLDRPIVNEWVISLAEILAKIAPALNIQRPLYDFTSTIDIDQAWKYRNKGIVRNTIGFLTDTLSFKTEKLRERILVQCANRQDPFYNFDWQKEHHQAFNINAIYFILLGKRGKFDKNIKPNHPHFQKLIQQLDSRAKMGIHPSYASNKNPESLNTEVNTLKKIINKPIKRSRQHFLMHRFPTTYQNLITQGIENDYTMGYSTHLGFRAGIGRSFLFYDLSSNQITNLRLHPFCYMDITPLHYLKWSPSETEIFLEHWMASLASKGVHIQTLWHNESFSETERWKNWSRVYLKTLSIHQKLCQNSHK